MKKALITKYSMTDYTSVVYRTGQEAICPKCGTLNSFNSITASEKAWHMSYFCSKCKRNGVFLMPDEGYEIVVTVKKKQ